MRTRSVGLNVRVSPAEKQRIQTVARHCGLTLSEYLRQRALGYEPRFHPPQAFFDGLALLDHLTDRLAQYDPAFAGEFRRCREGLVDSLLREEDASGDH